jgi:hypothetical protein
MSGRRSNNSLGTLTGTAGTESDSGPALILNPVAGWPHKNGQGVQLIGTLEIESRELRLGASQLSFRLRNIEVGNNAALATVLHQLKRAPVSFNRVRHHAMFSIEFAQAEIARCHFRLQGEPNGFRSSALATKTGARRLNLAPHAAPTNPAPSLNRAVWKNYCR